MNAQTQMSDLTRDFLAHDIDAGAFHHAEHMRVAYDLLKTQDFIDASANYAKGIRRIATEAGAVDKFNLTITYAFMSLIAERLADGDDADFESFLSANPDLMAKDVLARWYAPERLQTALARRVFLMPTVAA